MKVLKVIESKLGARFYLDLELTEYLEMAALEQGSTLDIVFRNILLDSSKSHI